MPPPSSVEELRSAAAVLVAGEPAAGFARLEVLDGCGYLAQLSVHPDAMRHGLGSALLDAAVQWTCDHGLPALALITFRDVPWNAPFYAARGFGVVTDLSPTLLALRRRERDELGMDALGARVVMRHQC